ncbi:hypothetical protein OG339_47795 (plasmid) [Streptosporangium sp. NBC_01495]|nr:hypothetical protein [Streptosporangium sp. NBC_01495]
MTGLQTEQRAVMVMAETFPAWEIRLSGLAEVFPLVGHRLRRKGA